MYQVKDSGWQFILYRIMSHVSGGQNSCIDFCTRTVVGKNNQWDRKEQNRKNAFQPTNEQNFKLE